MLDEFVLSQSGAVAEVLATNTAGVRTFASMRSNVNGQRLRLGEALVAIPTRIRSLAGVHTFVNVLIAAMMEHLVAVCALITQRLVGRYWLTVQLSQAILLMIQHFVLRAVPLAAERAEETTSTCVQLHVNIVVRLTSEALGANRTLERFFALACMLALMHHERLLVCESLSAIIAQERLLSSVLAFMTQQFDATAVVLAAEVAHVRILSSVQSFMHEQIHLFQKCLVAIRAAKRLRNRMNRFVSG